MRTFSFFALAVAVFAGCGDNASNPPGSTFPSGPGGGGAIDGGSTGGADSGTGISQMELLKSGTRIRMRVGTTPDGAKDFLGWRDTELNINCYQQKTSDEKMRCMPEYWTGGYGFVLSTYFADSACTQPIAVGYGCGAPTIVVDTSANTCDQAYRFREPGTQFTATTIFYKDSPTGTCESRAFTQDGKSTYWRVGPLLPDSQFAEFVESIE